MPGFGSQPYGSSPYGIGTPTTATSPGGAVLRHPEAATQTGSRRIDPVTRDYVTDENGRTLGMGDVQQLVAIAFATVKNSSAVQGLGQDLSSIESITDNVDRRVAEVIESALAHLTQRKLVELIGVTTTRLHSGALRINVRWRDLTSGPFSVEQKSEI